MTFSLVARCSATGMFGVAICSSAPAVAARCVYAQAGLGAVAVQNITDPRIGPRVLRLLADGATADQAVAILARTTPFVAYRQVLVVDAAGRGAVHSGGRMRGTASHAVRAGVAAAGTLLADEGVPHAMVDTFCDTRGALGDRLIAALQAGCALGGEAGPVHSAGLRLVDVAEWPVADLRCDWSEDAPVAMLASLWERYRPQMDGYVRRALDPRQTSGDAE